MTTTTDCACGLLQRCRYHGTMMRMIHKAYYGTSGLSEAIYAESDGYGERGYVPVQGYDWSGIRDSSVRAVERMYLIATRGPFEDWHD